ncbi:leucine rich repeat domain-containing protein [Biscogniauxia mediterranea]|nr:leucine rich repeat domain-containing protein [Biscogniauxia mediterranea]
MDSEDGELFVKQLAVYVRTHEKALANALQLRRQSGPRHGPSQSVSSIQIPQSPTPLPERPSTSASASGTLAAALSLGNLSFASHNAKSARLALTPHHLFYLLSRFEELGINVGPMKVRLENLHDTSTAANYVSFLSPSQRTKSRGSDAVSIRSVSSIRSVVSGMSSLWTSFGIGSSISAARNERQKAAAQADLKYLYSSFTKIPCLRLAPDWRAKLIRGYEEFPFDSAVPLYVFKNLQALEISHIDFRQFFGWDRLAEQVRSLTVKAASIEDPADILIDIVLDDMDKRRRRSAKVQTSPTGTYTHGSSPKRSPITPHPDMQRPNPTPAPTDRRHTVMDIHIGSMGNESIESTSAHSSRRASVARIETEESAITSKSGRPRSHSPGRPASSRHHSVNPRGSHKVKRSGSGSSHSSLSDSWHNPRNSASNLLAMGILPASKWRFLKHLSLADNSLTVIPATSLTPLANTLNSLDLSSNLFTQIPDSLATLTALRALNLSHCMIDSLHSLLRNPLPAISALNLRANRLHSIAGIEKLYPLERLDLRDNRLSDPMELARLTGIPDIREIWVEGNPFTRTHRDYRITIFNLFRQTPGFTEDIIIDASGPTYSERRYLVDRVAVPAAVPVVKPPVPEMHAIDVSKPTVVQDAPREPAVLRKERPSRPSPKAVASENNTSSTKRRRTPKRRIVDLATNDHPSGLPPQDICADEVASDTTAAATGSEDNYCICQSPERPDVPTKVLSETKSSSTLNPPEVPRIDTAIVSPPSEVFPNQETTRSWEDVQEWNLSGDVYRQKIETLRDKVGNGYLSVLNEESWESSHPAFLAADYKPTPPHHTPSPQAIHSGRTLG